MKKLILALMLFSQAGWTATPSNYGDLKDIWGVADLSNYPDLSAFFLNADALISIKPNTSSVHLNPDLPKPTIYVFRLSLNQNTRLKTEKDWHDFISKYIKNQKQGKLTERLSPSGRYFYDFTLSQGNDSSDMHSVYLAFRDENTVDLLVYDGVGPSLSQNIPLVTDLFSKMNAGLLKEMWLAGVPKKQ